MKGRGWRLLVTVLGAVTAVAVLPLPATAQDAFALAPVPGAASPETVTSWVQMAKGHLPGGPDAAADRALALTQRTLAGILDAVHRGRLMIPRQEVETVLARAVVLHTDVAAAQMLGAEQPDRANSGGLASLHFGMAAEVIKVLRSRVSSGSFIEAWFLAVASILASHQEISAAPAFLDSALARFPNDPRLLLLAGAVRELRASPRVQEATDLDGTAGRTGGVNDNLRRAEDFYRRAIRSAPNQVEARVRLGRVLCLTGRPKEAAGELEAARQALDTVRDAGGAIDPPVVYFLSLFTGEALEALGDVVAAREAYARASALFPAANSAWLDLSRLELRNGNRDAALAAVARMSRPATSLEGDDPGRKYWCAGPGRHANEMVAALVAAMPGGR